MSTADGDSFDSFTVAVDQSDIEDLRRRLGNTRWPDQLPGAGWQYGTNREYLERLCAYWRDDYDWSRFERRHNSHPQFMTSIDSQQVHFYHVESPSRHARPLLLAHGWPGSVTEFLEVIDPLANPDAHGGRSTDAFDIVVPSIPGYGFSGPTTKQGYDVRTVSDAFATLMERLGYDRYFVQGGDWGGFVAAILAETHPDRIDAIHTNLLPVSPSTLEDPMEMLDEQGMADYQETSSFRSEETGYQQIQSTKPQTLAYGLTDSPAGMAGWIVEKFRTWTDSDGDVESAVARDRLLDNISIYWLTETINSSMRLYYETDMKEVLPDSVDVPTGHARYPGEISKTPRVWAEEVYDIVYWNQLSEGGHFPAMEVPDVFVEDVRAFFRQVRGR